MKWLLAAFLPILDLCLLGPNCMVLGQQDYPWSYQFERPDHPYIHRAFPDGAGDLIVSTGDWRNREWIGGVETYMYWSTGIFRIDGPNMESIDCSEGTFVIDAAIDAGGRTWVAYGRGIDYHNYDLMAGSSQRVKGECEAPIDCATKGPHLGYKPAFFHLAEVTDFRIGLITADSLEEVTELRGRIPGELMYFNSNASGRIFAVSRDCADSGENCEYSLSWWDGEDIGSFEAAALPQADVPIYHIYGYPTVGPNGCVYLRIGLDTRPIEGAIYAFQTESREWFIIDHENSPLPDTYVPYFYVDDMGIKWFGTYQGLYRFDGNEWTLCTTENTDLPHDTVAQMAYDALDNVYYVITESDVFGQNHNCAFSALRPDGRRIGPPLYFNEMERYDHLPTICQDGTGVWWLCSYNTPDVYSYDHEQVLHWNSESILETGDLIGFVGSTMSGLRLCVAGCNRTSPKRIVVW